jgi:hypothetical protein
VGSEDRCIYFRTGILPEEMTGRTWRKVQVGVRKIRTDRASTSSSTGSSSGINISASPGRHHVHHLGTSAIVEKPTHSFMHKTPPQYVIIFFYSGNGVSLWFGLFKKCSLS